SDEGKPYTVSEGTYELRQIQAQGKNRYGVYFAHDREALSYHYERDADDPRIGHAFTLVVDDYGTVLRSVAAVYPRRSPAYDEQGKFHQTVSSVDYYEVPLTLSEAEVEHIDATNDLLRLGVPTESRSYELHGLTIAELASF